MKLKFLGRGASFYPQEGNNAAYFIDSDELFLIDCGEDVFGKLIKNKLLEDKKAINLMVTHLHSDHIASLGSFILYCYYALGTKLNIIVQKDLKYLDDLKKLVEIFGCSNDLVNYRDVNTYQGYQYFDEIEFIETKHVDSLDCYGIKFKKADLVTYYSGDTRVIDEVKMILENENVDYVYVDVNTSNAASRVHLYLGEVLELNHQYLDKIYCMHINSKECLEMIKEYGLKVVEIAKN